TGGGTNLKPQRAQRYTKDRTKGRNNARLPASQELMRPIPFILFILAILPCPALAFERLVVLPARILLTGRYSEARVLVSFGNRDASDNARLDVADRRVAAVDEDGFVRPRGD